MKSLKAYKAHIVKVNTELGYAFALTSKRHEVFIKIPVEVIHYFTVGRTIKLTYEMTQRGYLATDYTY